MSPRLIADKSLALLTIVIAEHDIQLAELSNVVRPDNLENPSQILIREVDWKLRNGLDEIEGLGPTTDG